MLLYMPKQIDTSYMIGILQVNHPPEKFSGKKCTKKSKSRDR